MNKPLTSSDTAPRADRTGEARVTTPPIAPHRLCTTLIVALALALSGAGGMTATTAHGLPDLPDGVIAERAAEPGETVPPRPFDGRPW